MGRRKWIVPGQGVPDLIGMENCKYFDRTATYLIVRDLMPTSPRFLGRHDFYSYRSASIGSTENARLAGISAASAAVVKRSRATAATINGVWVLPSAHRRKT